MRKLVETEAFRGVAPPPLARERMLFWIEQLERGVLARVTESQAEQTFNAEIFGTVLGYEQFGSAREATLMAKRAGHSGRHTPDFVLGRFDVGASIEEWRVVGEIKGARVDLDQPQLGRRNKETPVEQGFRYATHGRPGVDWIVVTNFAEIRLYRNGFADAYHCWMVADLKEEGRFFEFFAVMRPAGLVGTPGLGPGLASRIYEATVAAGKELTEGFYSLYHLVQADLVRHLATETASAGMSVKELYGKAHKLLNRALFVAFCEDHPAALLPRNTLRATMSRSAGAGRWRAFRQLFDALNRGEAIGGVAYNAFNGGLFAPDPFLDAIDLPNALFERRYQAGKGRRRSSAITGIFGFDIYDFADDLNAQALGAIFEQSLKDLPEGTAAVRGVGSVEVSSQEAGGVYYTPREITSYIVRRALEEQLKTIRMLVDRETDRRVEAEKRRLRRQLTEAERESLRFTLLAARVGELRVVDPACGSGAFLVETLAQLHAEYERINKTIAALRGTPGQLSTLDLDRQILRRNLFGRDILPESVEITRLSIWLQTARPGEPLETLDQSIFACDSLRSEEAACFDVVVGNPPWGAELEGWTEDEVRRRFPQAGSERDSYALFIIRACELLRPGGVLAYVIPNSWLTVHGYAGFREWMMREFEIVEIANVWKIFRDVNHDACIVVARKRDRSIPTETSIGGFAVRALARGRSETAKLADLRTSSWWRDHVTSEAFQRAQNDVRFEVIYPQRVAVEIDRATRRAQPLGGMADVTVGIQVYHHTRVSQDDIKARVFHARYRKTEEWHPYVDANDAQRYLLREPSDQWLRYSDRLRDKRSLEHYGEPRILVQQIFWRRLSAVLQVPAVPCLYLNTIFSVSRAQELPLAAVLGVLNSRFISASYERRANRLFGDKFPKVSRADLASTPMPVLRETAAADLASAALALQACWTNLRNSLAAADERLVAVGPTLRLARAGRFWESDERTLLAWAGGQAGLLSPGMSAVARDAFRAARNAINEGWHLVIEAERTVEDLVSAAFGLPDSLIDGLSGSYFEPQPEWALPV